jgi:hypothetical protein
VVADSPGRHRDLHAWPETVAPTRYELVRSDFRPDKELQLLSLQFARKVSRHSQFPVCVSASGVHGNLPVEIINARMFRPPLTLFPPPAPAVSRLGRARFLRKA